MNSAGYTAQSVELSDSSVASSALMSPSSVTKYVEWKRVLLYGVLALIAFGAIIYVGSYFTGYSSCGTKKVITNTTPYEDQMIEEAPARSKASILYEHNDPVNYNY
jgi:hypothetical protein